MRTCRARSTHPDKRRTRKGPRKDGGVQRQSERPKLASPKTLELLNLWPKKLKRNPAPKKEGKPQPMLWKTRAAPAVALEAAAIAEAPGHRCGADGR